MVTFEWLPTLVVRKCVSLSKTYASRPGLQNAATKARQDCRPYFVRVLPTWRHGNIAISSRRRICPAGTPKACCSALQGRTQANISEGALEKKQNYHYLNLFLKTNFVLNLLKPTQSFSGVVRTPKTSPYCFRQPPFRNVERRPPRVPRRKRTTIINYYSVLMTESNTRHVTSLCPLLVFFGPNRRGSGPGCLFAV